MNTQNEKGAAVRLTPSQAKLMARIQKREAVGPWTPPPGYGAHERGMVNRLWTKGLVEIEGPYPDRTWYNLYPLTDAGRAALVAAEGAK